MSDETKELEGERIPVTYDGYERAFCKAATCGDVHAIEKLWHRIADPVIVEHALRDAAGNGHGAVIQRIVNLVEGIGGEIELKDYNMVLKYAAAGGHEEIVDQMLACGANGFNLALYVAARENHLSIVKKMVERGADYRLPWTCAQVTGQTEILEYFKSLETHEANAQEAPRTRGQSPI